MRIIKWIIIILFISGIGFAGYWFGLRRSNSANDASGGNTKVVAQVSLATAKQSKISETITAYGSIIARPGKAHAVSVLFDSVVNHVLVVPGEMVTNGQVLLDIQPSASARLQLDQAKAAAAAERINLKQTQQRYDLKFVTDQDLAQAKKAFDMAKLQLRSMESRGIETERQIKSAINGIVSQVAVHDGQIVNAGTPFIELVAHDEIEARLGVEPEASATLTVGQPIHLFPVHAAEVKPFEGRIRLITRRINPDTNLVDVYVTPPSGAKLLLDAYLRAEIKTASHTGLVVPRSAVLPRGNRDILFTVENGHAVQHVVQSGLRTTNEIEIVSPQLPDGTQVVVQGNYELTNGMAVTTTNQP